MPPPPTTIRSADRPFWIVAPIGALVTAGVLLRDAPHAWIEIVYRALTDGPILLAWLAAATGIGWWIVRAFNARATSHDRLLVLVSSAALGMGAISITTLGLGLIGVLTTATSWILLMIGLPALAAAFRRDRTIFGFRASIECTGAPWALLLLVVPMTWMGLAALVPAGLLWPAEPAGYDVVAYHLQAPREWFGLGRIAPSPHNVFAFMPFNVEMQFLLAMHLRGDAWESMILAQLMHATMIALVPIALYAWARPMGQLRASIIAAIAGTMPWMGLLGAVAYNEGGLLLWGTLALVWLMRGDLRGAMVGGMFAGLACGAKLTGVPLLLVIVPFAVLVASRIARPDIDEPRVGIGGVGTFFVVGMLVLSPWLIRNTVWTGNPLFPERMEWFGGGAMDVLQQERWRAAHSPRADQSSIASRMSALIAHTATEWRGAYWLGAGMIGVIALGLIRRSALGLTLAIALLGLVAFWLTLTHLQGRFLVFAIPLVAMGAMLLPARVMPIALVPAVASLIIGFIFAGRDLSRVSPVMGMTDPQQLTALALQDEELASLITQTDRPIVLVGEAKAYLYAVPADRLIWRSVFDVASHAPSAPPLPADDFVRAWVGDVPAGAIVIVFPAELRRFADTYRYIPPIPAQWQPMSAPFVYRR